ncbi:MULTISPECIES: hypothetical protein [unclassified Microbacterium]|uniref:hypothetical protein n=1 Tax=unclassified Microbacterium TaxID=2609290 RepID=UPI003435C788
MSAVLGVDPSLTVSGCALVQWEPDTTPLWETWRGRTSPAEVENAETSRRRIRKMLAEILAFVPPRLTLSVVEGPAMGAKYTPLADERAGLRWMLVDQLCARGPVVLLTPNTRQVLAHSDSIPRGTTSTVRKGLVLNSVRLLVPEAHVPDHNVADGVALARAGAHAAGLEAPYTAKQISAHAKVAWPIDSEQQLAGMGK